MFETVAPEKFAPRSRKLWYESLPLSVGAHALVLGAVLTMNSWTVTFPLETPKKLTLYRLETIPTPPPPPPPAAPPKRVENVQVRPVQPREDVAPSLIPDTIPVVLPPTPAITELVEGVEGGVEGGVVGGEVGGVEGGEIGGIIGGTLGSVGDAPPPDTVVVKRDAPLPTAPMSMTFPKYPDDARIRGWEDQLVVKYTIGKNGRVREVIVLSKPEREVFEKITVKAIRGWRFRPYKKDGVAQEVVHELTIFFKLEPS